MNLRLVTAQNKDEWEEFIFKHAPYALFQSWQWGEVEKRLDVKVWRLGWFYKNKLVGVAQIQKVSARRGTFLHIRHGPIGTINFEDVKKLGKDEGAWFIRISPQISSDNELRELGFKSAPIHEVDAERSWVLDLDSSEEDLLGAMRKTIRYEIKHGDGITLEKSKDIHRFFRLYNETSKRHNFVQHVGIREEFETLDCDLFVASHEGRDLASAIIVYYGNQAIYHHGASLPSKLPASTAVQWRAILEAKKRGMKLYNFWGIAPDDKPNHPWRGITLFKKGFGGRQVQYIHAQDLPLSPLYSITWIIETLRRRARGY